MVDAKARRKLAFLAAYGPAVLFLAVALAFFDLAMLNFRCDTDAHCFEPPPSGRDGAYVLKNLIMTVIAFSPAALVIRARENKTARLGAIACMLRWTAAVFAVGAAGVVFQVACPTLAAQIFRTRLSGLTYGDRDFAPIDIWWFGFCLLFFGVGLGPLAGTIYALVLHWIAPREAAGE